MTSNSFFERTGMTFTFEKIPSEDNVSKVVVDESVIKGESEPLLVYESMEEADEIPPKAAPDE